MPMTAPKKTGGDYTPHPAGMYPAICTSVLDTGTVWNEKQQKYQRKLLLKFVTDQLMPAKEGEEAKPYEVNVWKTYSMFHNAHLAAMVQSWLGRNMNQDQLDAFDLSTLAGKPALLNISQSDDGKYANVQTVNPLPKSMKPPMMPHPPVVLNMEAPNEVVINSLSERLQERIRSSLEYRGEKAENAPQKASPAARKDMGGTDVDVPAEAYEDDVPW